MHIIQMFLKENTEHSKYIAGSCSNTNVAWKANAGGA